MADNYSVVPSPDVLVDGFPRASACCVWQDGLSLYVLSASHALQGSHDVTWYGIDGLGGGDGTVEPDSVWLSMPGGELDAALVRVRTLGPFGSSSAYPWGAAIMPWGGVPAGESVGICGKYGLVFATFEAYLPAGRYIEPRYYGRLMQFRYDGHGTWDGDSGSPIISMPEGMLVGMHIAKDEAAGHTLGVSAEDIETVFGQRWFGLGLRP